MKNIREDLLTLSKENRAYLAAIGITHCMLLDKGYSGTDYNFWVTANSDVSDKYAVSAFYSTSEQSKGVEVVKRMNKLMEQINNIK